MKKIISSVLVLLVLAASFVLPVSADAQALYFGEITVTMPEVKAEVKGTGYDISDVSASLGTEQLTVNSLQAYDASSHSTCVYMLVDLSSSMDYYSDIIKESIINYSNTLDANDNLVLITFGEEVEVLLDGTESLSDLQSIVYSLECNESGTLFYEALSKAYDIANSSISNFDREYVVAFSDGIDEHMEDGKITYDEITSKFSTHSLPLYAACFEAYDTYYSSSTDKFGELARSSGGSLMMLHSTSDFDSLMAQINDVTIISMSAGSNIADGSTQLLSLKIGDKILEKQVPVVRSITDTSAPIVTEYKFDSKTLTLSLTFSEKLSENAGNASAYKITDSEGKAAEIVSVNYNNSDLTADIVLKNMKDGDYTVTFNSITDLSLESNPLTGELKFTAEGVAAAEGNTEGFPLWLILVIVFVIVALGVGVVLIVVLTSRRKSDEPSVVPAPVPVSEPQNQYNYVQNSANVKHHVIVNTSKKVRLHIKTGNISEQSVETQIQSSLIIGRSNTCDIFVDDTKMSRQHFAIEYDSDNFYIMDLQSRNGTMLNGYKVVGRQILRSGDKIIAGLSDIQFTLVG